VPSWVFKIPLEMRIIYLTRHKCIYSRTIFPRHFLFNVLMHYTQLLCYSFVGSTLKIILWERNLYHQFGLIGTIKLVQTSTHYCVVLGRTYSLPIVQTMSNLAQFEAIPMLCPNRKIHYNWLSQHGIYNMLLTVCIYRMHLAILN
jgi:hypothetical protein